MIVGRRDIIAAIATPAGAGGVGIVRISGPGAGRVVAALLRRSEDSFPDRTLVYGVAVDADGQRLDEVLAVVMRGPHSFTGEDVAELHGHGGTLNMARLLRAVIGAGARHAEPGEFTRRAFENGRLDLTRAEAIADVIQASSERAWRLAQAQLSGGLGDRVAELRSRATQLLAEVEACIDFPEEGEEYLAHHEVAERARQLGDDIGRLAGTFTLGKALRDGIEVAIAGPVNAGKSSIFNRLAGKERAIVDASPGTTRDFVEVTVTWEGIPVTLIDTAGEREAESHVERQGIEMGRRRSAEADLLVRVHSADVPLPQDRQSLAAADGRSRELHVITKGDLLELGEGSAVAGMLVTSSRTGQGIDELKRAILEAACCGVTESDDGQVVTSERQRSLLEAAAAAFHRVAQGVAMQVPTEVLAIEIREGTERLAEIVGERVGEEVLDELFKRFCIGK